MYLDILGISTTKIICVLILLTIATAGNGQDYPYSVNGAHKSVIVQNQGPEGQRTIFRPELLRSNGHGVILWGNGRRMAPISYRELLQHFASWGFIVVAANTSDAISGEEMIAGGKWLFEQAAISSSNYHQSLSGKICVVGHSRGARGTINAGTAENVTCTVPIQPVWEDAITRQNSPMFLFAGGEDPFVKVEEVQEIFDATNVNSIFAIKEIATHWEPTKPGPKFKHYLTAWLMLHLDEAQNLSQMFYGENCDLCVEQGWRLQHRNL